MRAFKIKLTILCFVFFLLGEHAYAQALFVSPGQVHSETANIPPFSDAHDWEWDADCDGVETTFVNDNTGTFYVPADVTCCTITFDGHGEYTDISGDHSMGHQGTYNVLPYINLTSNPVLLNYPIPNPLYPCQTFYAITTAGGGNGLSCAIAQGCPNASITWAVNGSNAGSGTNITVTVPCNASVSSPVVIDATYHCGTFNLQLNHISLNVALYPPTISGPQSIGCGTPVQAGNNTVVYTAVYSPVTHSVGAGYWNWNWPSNMTPTNPLSIHDQTISLDVTGPGSGNVSVKAYSTDGSVSSAQFNYPVSVCCVPVITDNTTLNSGNVGYMKEASSTINSTNDIQSTGTATVHAGIEVRLFPGFNAVQGSQVHLYNASCNSGYMRTMPPSNGEDSITASNGPSDQNLQAALASPVTYSVYTAKDPTGISKSLNPKAGFSVAPNPSSGVFSLQTKRGFSGWLTVIDVSGQVIKKIILTKELKEYTIDLTGYPTGIYLLNVDADEGHFSKKIILQ